MALRGKTPTASNKRLKALFFGEAGSGKTTAAIKFPRPYLIDTEKGAVNDQYVKILKDRGGVSFATSDFDEMVREVRALLSEKHDYATLIIDPITTVYDDLINKAEQKVGSEFGRHYGEAKKEWKRLGNLLTRLDMNVIITCHAKNLYGDNLKVLGQTFDGPKGLDYLFDLSFLISKRGPERVGTVKKTRIEAFPDGDVFPFSYDAIADRYGREVLERDAVVVALATAEQVATLRDIIEARKDGQDLQTKWLKAADADELADLTAEQAAKCIEKFGGKAVTV